LAQAWLERRARRAHGERLGDPSASTAACQAMELPARLSKSLRGLALEWRCAAGLAALAGLLALRRLLRPRHAKFREVPGAWPLGVLLQLGPGGADMARKVDEWAAEYGQDAAYEMNLLGQRVVVVCDWENAQQVLSKRPHRVTKPKVYASVGQLFAGIFFSEGNTWKQERKLMAPAFNHRNVESYVPAIQDTIDRLLTALEKTVGRAEPANFSNLMVSFSADVILKVSTGVDHHVLQDDLCEAQVVKDTHCAIDGALNRIMSPLPYWKIPGLANLIDGSDAAAQRIAKVMTDAMHRMAGSGAATVVEKLRESQERMSEKELLGNLQILLIAGTDTTSKTLAWAFYYLSLDRELQSAVAREALERLPEGPVSQDQLEVLPLVSAVWLEVLRVKGPAPFDAFNNAETLTIAGRDVPPGTELYVLYRYLFHSDPNVKEALGSDLDVFRPRRWLNAAGSIIRLAPFDTLFFGHGARICLGMRLANYEGRLVIAKVLKQFSLKRWQGPPLAERTSFVLMPAEDVRIGVERRV